MAKRVAQTTLNASTIDILNVIRQNASFSYQNQIPVITQATDIPKVGDVLYGNVALANEFLNSLMNRIALVRAKSAMFNNPYARLKKGFLEFGETVEEIFVKLAKVVDFSVEKAEIRELRRVVPEVETAFHAINWRAMYPVTIEQSELKHAFLSAEGVSDLIQKIIDAIYTAAEYDEFLLFKYMLIKAVSSGRFYPDSIGDGSDLKDAAVEFRGLSNMMTFIKTDYNEAGVQNSTPKDRQVIFMDARFNASFDVNVLAAAFNMEKADFMGRLYLIDDWTTFDNDRFAVIRSNSDGLEEVTATELSLMTNVKAILIDEDWFQVYDDLAEFREKEVASGLYWNYFYHTWKIISHSPFANAVVFATSSATITLPSTITVTIASKDVSAEATVFTLDVEPASPTMKPNNVQFLQTDAMIADGIAVQKYGALIIPVSAASESITLKATVNGAGYTAGSAITAASDVGDTVTLAKDA